jgi:hypothetical protein
MLGKHNHAVAGLTKTVTFTASARKGKEDIESNKTEYKTVGRKENVLRESTQQVLSLKTVKRSAHCRDKSSSI